MQSEKIPSEKSERNSADGNSQSGNFVANCSAFLRRTIFTRENLWVLIVAAMLLLIFVFGTMGVQPRFVYSGF